jgi:hypothetical protein
VPDPWLILAVIATAMVIACLRIVGHEYATAVAWHDLRVEVQRLRRQQHARLEQIDGKEPTLRRIVTRQRPGSLRTQPGGTSETDSYELGEAVEVADEPVELAA